MVYLSSGVIAVFLLFSIVMPEKAAYSYSLAKQFISQNLGWYYVGLLSSIFIFLIYLALGPYGNIRLGKDDEGPEFSYFAWFSMLFGAGIGIGILFWSIAEPISHFKDNPFLSPEQGLTQEAAQTAMRLTLFHWGFHGWALYAMVGMALAYFSYRRGFPLSIRFGLHSIFGDRIYGFTGHLVDLLAIVGTVFGVATSLGLGAQQMNAGFNYLFDLEITVNHQILIIFVISVIATLSVLTGVNKGIRILSELNMKLTFFILLFFLIFGPTVYLLSSFVTNVGDYVSTMIPLGFWVESDINSSWQADWTIFYWGWWLSWSPFCGIFIARISRGRTIREFVAGVLLAPTLLSAFWITCFGNTAIFIELWGAGGIVESVEDNLTLSLFKTIELMQLGDVLTLIGVSVCIIMLVTYFVTSADSATLVICTLLSLGETKTPKKFRIFWGLSIGAVSIVLLLIGGLKSIQTASIVAALPLSFVLILICFSMLKSLREEVKG